MQNAKVVVVGANDTAFAAADGRYAFATLPEGVFTVRAMFIGFLRAEQDSVRVVNGWSVRLDFRLRQPNCDLDCNPVLVPAPAKKPR